MSVKDVLQSLVDDGMVDSDRIGTSNYFWAFPSKASNQVSSFHGNHWIIQQGEVSHGCVLTETDKGALKGTTEPGKLTYPQLLSIISLLWTSVPFH